MLEKNSFEIKRGDLFRYRGYTYRATADATGEFSSYVKVLDSEDMPSEIILPSGSVVLVEA